MISRRCIRLILACTALAACTYLDGQAPQFIGPIADCEGVTVHSIGIVHDVDGNPIAGAEINFRNEPSDCPQSEAFDVTVVTDNEGRFELGQIETGIADFTIMSVTASGYESFTREGHLAPQEGILQVEITLQPEETATPDT